MGNIATSDLPAVSSDWWASLRLQWAAGPESVITTTLFLIITLYRTVFRSPNGTKRRHLLRIGSPWVPLYRHGVLIQHTGQSPPGNSFQLTFTRQWRFSLMVIANHSSFFCFSSADTCASSVPKAPAFDATSLVPHHYTAFMNATRGIHVYIKTVAGVVDIPRIYRITPVRYTPDNCQQVRHLCVSCCSGCGISPIVVACFLQLVVVPGHDRIISARRWYLL